MFEHFLHLDPTSTQCREYLKKHPEIIALWSAAGIENVPWIAIWETKIALTVGEYDVDLRDIRKLMADAYSYGYGDGY